MSVVNAPNVRYASIDYGDDIKRIALRELGDASKWVSLVILNELKPPYIADTPSSGVLSYGDQLKVPASASSVSAIDDPAEVYGTDIYLIGKRLSVSGGDVDVVTGLANFKQALTLHVDVDKRELAFHPEFGCFVRSVLGATNGPTAGQLAAFYVKSALLEDARVDSVPACLATITGDLIKIDATVIPISGKPVDLMLVV